MDQAGRDNRGNQFNPNNERYQGGHTYFTGPRDKPVMDNKAQQQNPNNPNYHGNRN